MSTMGESEARNATKHVHSQQHQAAVAADMPYNWVPQNIPKIPGATIDVIAYLMDSTKKSPRLWCHICKKDIDGTKQGVLRHLESGTHARGVPNDGLSSLERFLRNRPTEFREIDRDNYYCIVCDKNVQTTIVQQHAESKGHKGDYCRKMPLLLRYF